MTGNCTVPFTSMNNPTIHTENYDIDGKGKKENDCLSFSTFFVRQ